MDKHHERAAVNIPLGRTGLAAEVADLALLPLSERSTFITGVGINFDGGQSPVS